MKYPGKLHFALTLLSAILLVCVLMFDSTSAAPQGETVNEIAMTAELDALVDQWAGMLDRSPTQQEQVLINERIKKLVGMFNNNPAELILKVVQQREKYRDDERKIWATVFILQQLFPLTSADQVVEVVSPHLTTDSLQLRKDYHEILAQVLRTKPSWDFAAIRRFLKKHDGNVEPMLVDFLLKDAPEETLLCLTNFFVHGKEERTEMLLSYRTIDTLIWRKFYLGKLERLTSEEITALRSFSNDKYWWARLYVAQIMLQHPELRQSESIQTLRTDEHPLVRQTVEMIEPKKADEQVNPAPAE